MINRSIHVWPKEEKDRGIQIMNGRFIFPNLLRLSFHSKILIHIKETKSNFLVLCRSAYKKAQEEGLKFSVKKD